jgi:hypothetical protein
MCQDDYHVFTGFDKVTSFHGTTPKNYGLNKIHQISKGKPGFFNLALLLAHQPMPLPKRQQFQLP